LPPGNGSWRGAFGWYTALTGPNSQSQWIHGTFGWGSDGDKFIQATKGLDNGLLGRIAAAFKDLRSHGCTRVENRAIAYMRHILPVGTEIFRVYAKEALRDPSLAAYQLQKQTKPWDYILTKEGVRQTGGPDSDKNLSLARGVSSNLILEKGEYQVDQYPTAQGYIKGASNGQRRKGYSGNIYDIDDANFRGVFVVDEGRFIGYAHPAGVPVGGYPDHSLPDYLTTSGSYTLGTAGTN
jgi:hypothetical protein